MRYRIPAGTEMTPELLAKYIGKHKGDVAQYNKKYQQAYENKYDILDFNIHPRKPRWKPDNRVSINFAKYLVDTFNGFFCGIPIKVTSEDEKVSKYLEYLAQYNDMDDMTAEIAKMADIHGGGHEMYFNDESGELGVMFVSPLESFFLVDDSILERKLYFIRYYKDANNVERGSWSNDSYVQRFVREGSYKWTDEPTPHYFEGVPATEFLENNEHLGLFVSVLPAINQYNKILSEAANNIDYFADAYLKIIGAKLTKDEERWIKTNRVINFEGLSDTTPQVEFLAKPDADNAQEHLLDRLERQIFAISMVANISDENFAGDSSGIAMRYKLQAMTNLFRTKERKFTAALNRRYKILFSNPTAKASYGISPNDWLKLDYHFTPNYPANIEAEAEVVAKLDGQVSTETKLKNLSIIDNVQEEIDRMKKEEEEKKEDSVMNKLFSKSGGQNTPPDEQNGGEEGKKE